MIPTSLPHMMILGTYDEEYTKFLLNKWGRRRRGQPKKPIGEDINSLRAKIIVSIRKHPGMNRTNRELIGFAQRLERAHGVGIWNVFGVTTSKPQLFPSDRPDDLHINLPTLETSVSRGIRSLQRRKLKKT